MLRLLHITSCLLLFLSVNVAESLIVGQVFDQTTGEPVVAANIFDQTSSMGTITDFSGKFTLKTEIDSCNLLITHIAYNPLKMVVSRNAQSINIQLVPRMLQGPQITVSGTRAGDRLTPVSFSNIDRNAIKDHHTTEDIPFLVSGAPNVYAYADGGNSVGYSYVKMRGFDQKRIGVMVNNVPLNDPEEHQVYWVDLADLAENTEDIQIQRGVGSSTYGNATFGGMINIQTQLPKMQQSIGFQSGYGSFGTFKSAVSLSQPLSSNLALLTRFSVIGSNGFRDGASSRLYSYYTQLIWRRSRWLHKLLLFGGYERTGLSYNGIPASIYQTNRKYNDFASYSHSVDDFWQPHAQWNTHWQALPFLNMENTFYYIYGRGFYEQLKDGISPTQLAYYSLPENLEISELIRRKWVFKHQLGWIHRWEAQLSRHEFTAGWHVWGFHSDHQGRVIRLEQTSADHLYYHYNSVKSNLSFFLQDMLRLNSDFSLYINVLNEYKDFSLKQRNVGNFTGDSLNHIYGSYRFLSPRIGLNWNLSARHNLYFNFSRAWREPSDQDIFDTWSGPDDLGATPLFNHRTAILNDQGQVKRIEWQDPIIKAEVVNDWELGWGWTQSRWMFKLNGYIMRFRNEIVPLGAMNEDGYPVRGNAPESAHEGVETETRLTLSRSLQISFAGAWSMNRFIEFTQYTWSDDWTTVDTLDLSANRIPLYPEWLGQINFTINHFGVKQIWGFRYSGSQFLETQNIADRSLDPFWLVNVQFIWKLPLEWQSESIRFYAKIENILNKKYEPAGYYDGENYYYPGAPFNFFIGFRWGD